MATFLDISPALPRAHEQPKNFKDMMEMEE
jgi:hypothetical protein